MLFRSRAPLQKNLVTRHRMYQITRSYFDALQFLEVETPTLFKSTPEDVRILMIDPKRIELSLYEGIPHLLHPVVVEPKKAAIALRWAVEEMDRRYKRFAEKGSDAWFQESPADLLSHYDPSKDPEAPKGLDIASLAKLYDIFDVWFEAGKIGRAHV